MDPLSFLKSIWKQSDSQPIQTNLLKVKPGQIISGRIIKLLPNQMAEIQIGTGKLIAKLEASLTVNQQYWFQVQPGDEKIHLKLIKKNEGDSILPNPKMITAEMAAVSNNEGVIEQFVTQVPIQVGPDKSDAIIQWNGRKKEDGKMDPNDCRILFYLELKNIGEILADLQFQNRKLSITLINGVPELHAFIDSQIAILKENLQKLNYQLGTVKIEQPLSDKPLKALIKKNTHPSAVETGRRSEVDIRI